jgi:hypothetical protein
MSSFFYKYLTAQSFIKGKKTSLYFSRFIFQIYRSLPTLLRLATISFRFFNFFYRSCYSLIHFRFWLLTLNHFVVIYQSLFLIRIITEYLFINQHHSNNTIKAIFYLSEPYFKVVQYFGPKGMLGSILAYQAIGILGSLIQKLSRIIISYHNNSKNLRELELLLNIGLYEKIIFN